MSWKVYIQARYGKTHPLLSHICILHLPDNYAFRKVANQFLAELQGTLKICENRAANHHTLVSVSARLSPPDKIDLNPSSINLQHWMHANASKCQNHSFIKMANHIVLATELHSLRWSKLTMTMRVTCNVMKSLNTPQTFVDVDSNDLHQRCDMATIKKNKNKKKEKEERWPGRCRLSPAWNQCWLWAFVSSPESWHSPRRVMESPSPTVCVFSKRRRRRRQDSTGCSRASSVRWSRSKYANRKHHQYKLWETGRQTHVRTHACRHTYKDYVKARKDMAAAKRSGSVL